MFFPTSSVLRSATLAVMVAEMKKEAVAAGFKVALAGIKCGPALVAKGALASVKLSAKGVAAWGSRLMHVH